MRFGAFEVAGDFHRAAPEFVKDPMGLKHKCPADSTPAHLFIDNESCNAPDQPFAVQQGRPVETYHAHDLILNYRNEHTVVPGFGKGCQLAAGRLFGNRMAEL